MIIYNIISVEEWKLCVTCCRMFDIRVTPHVHRHKGRYDYYIHQVCPLKRLA